MTEKEFLEAHLKIFPELMEIYKKVQLENETEIERLKHLIDVSRPWVQLAQRKTTSGITFLQTENWLKQTLEE